MCCFVGWVLVVVIGFASGVLLFCLWVSDLLLIARFASFVLWVRLLDAALLWVNSVVALTVLSLFYCCCLWLMVMLTVCRWRAVCSGCWLRVLVVWAVRVFLAVGWLFVLFGFDVV